MTLCLAASEQGDGKIQGEGKMPPAGQTIRNNIVRDINQTVRLRACVHQNAFFLHCQCPFSVQININIINAKTFNLRCSLFSLLAGFVSVYSVSPVNQTQEWVGLRISTLLTMAEEKRILAVIDNPVINDLTSKGYHDQPFISTVKANLFKK